MSVLFEAHDLTVGYERPVVHEISFTADSGEIVGILGRNGYGKTTLLRGIMGGVTCFSGEILVDGVPCRNLPAKKRARYLSVLPQQTEIMGGILAREVIEMGRYPYGGLFGDIGEAGKRLIEETAETLDITNLLESDCGKLSQGQRQLVLLARLFVQDTPVMLLDEPDASLDFYNTHILFSTLSTMIREQQKAAILVLHNPELALQWCDRLVILKHGRIAAELRPATADERETEDALRLLYENIQVRRDPFSGKLRCYPSLPTRAPSSRPVAPT